MIKRILIIGFGMMGKSHLYSFINSKHKYQISIYDKKNYSKIEISNYFNKVNFLKKFPKKKKYDCVIISLSLGSKYSSIYVVTNILLSVP